MKQLQGVHDWFWVECGRFGVELVTRVWGWWCEAFDGELFIGVVEVDGLEVLGMRIGYRFECVGVLIFVVV